MIDLDVDALKAELNGIYEERNHVCTVSCCSCLVAALAWSWENGGKKVMGACQALISLVLPARVI